MTRSLLFSSLAAGLIASSASADVLRFESGRATQQTTGPTWHDIVFGDGLPCAVGNIVRLGKSVADGAGVVGSMPTSGSGLMAGDVRRYPCWYRNPTGSQRGFAFHLSSGYEITWQGSAANSGTTVHR